MLVDYFASNLFGNYYFYNTDVRNSTMSILSDGYTAVKYYEYNEYGKQTTKGNSSFINDMTYTGAVTEGGNVFYMNARFYDANNGRFLTQDTYKGNMYEPMSQNLYSYVGNNPVNYIDPTGHFPVLAAIITTVIIAATAVGVSGCTSVEETADTITDVKDTVVGMDAIFKAAEEVNSMSYLSKYNDQINIQLAIDEGSADSIYLQPVYLSNATGADPDELAQWYRDDIIFYTAGSNSTYLRKSLSYMQATAGKSGMDAAFDILLDTAEKSNSPLKGYYAALDEFVNLIPDTEYVLIYGDMGTE